MQMRAAGLLSAFTNDRDEDDDGDVWGAVRRSPWRQVLTSATSATSSVDVLRGRYGVTHVVSLDDRRPAGSHWLFLCVDSRHFNIVKSKEQLDLNVCAEAARWIDATITSNPQNRVLVHCRDGRSACAALVLYTMLTWARMSVSTALTVLREFHDELALRPWWLDALRRYALAALGTNLDWFLKPSFARQWPHLTDTLDSIRIATTAPAATSNVLNNTGWVGAFGWLGVGDLLCGCVRVCREWRRLITVEHAVRLVGPLVDAAKTRFGHLVTHWPPWVPGVDVWSDLQSIYARVVAAIFDLPHELWHPEEPLAPPWFVLDVPELLSAFALPAHQILSVCVQPQKSDSSWPRPHGERGLSKLVCQWWVFGLLEQRLARAGKDRVQAAHQVARVARVPWPVAAYVSQTAITSTTRETELGAFEPLAAAALARLTPPVAPISA